jgi:asparagine synthase (glutamine-hydrolysing)
MLYLDTKTWLPNDILIKADRMSMAASIELRTPFLDYRLVEYAATIPCGYKLRFGQTKYILKKAMRKVLPKQIINRGKSGFPTPVADILRGELRDHATEVLLDRDSEERGYFDPELIRTLLNEHREGVADHSGPLWRLLILEQWHREFIASRPVKTISAAMAGIGVQFLEFFLTVAENFRLAAFL